MLQNVVKQCVSPQLAVCEGEHAGLWDRPKRAAGPHAPAGGAYMIDPQNHILTLRNVKVMYMAH